MRFLWWLRLFVFYVGLSLATIFFAMFGILTLVFPKSFQYWFITRWSHFFIQWARFICGLNYQVHGLEHLPDKPCVVMCNHQSAWETIFMQTLLPRQSWILKKELLYIPFFGWGLRLLDPIAINRKDKHALRQMLQAGQEKLQQGIWIIIFPEGTRVPPSQDKPFSRSGAALALQATVPVLPICHNAGVFWPKGAMIKKPGTIQFILGPVISTNQSHDATEITEKARQWILHEKSKILSQ